MNTRRTVAVTAAACLFVAATTWRAPTAGAQEMKKGGAAGKFTLTCAAFDNGKEIPRKYTRDADNLSPPLAWTAPPAGTKSFVLICDDPDGRDWVHWILYRIPGIERELREGIAREVEPNDEYRQAMNSWKTIGYDGPGPPKGTGVHHYFFRLYAIDKAAVDVPAKTSRAQLEKAMEGHILGKAELMGTYSRG